MGKLADKYWQKIPQHFNNIILDEYIVMPNYVHGIIIINNNITNGGNTMHGGRDAIYRVSSIASLQGDLKLSMATKMGGFKIIVKNE